MFSPFISPCSLACHQIPFPPSLHRAMVLAAIAMTATTTSSRSTSKGLGSEATETNPMQAWWETIAKARSAIHSLNATIGPLPSIHQLQDSDSPANALLHCPHTAALISARLSSPASGSASDPLCRWLYDTFQTTDPDLHLVVLRYVPIVAGLYLSRIVAHNFSEPPAGFEAVILALYTSEVKARAGRPVVVNIPDLGNPSLYHQPRNPSTGGSGSHAVGQMCAPLEPHVAIKSTKRAAVVGVALDLFYRKIALMPAAAKVEFCEFVQGWAGQNCSCLGKLDDDVAGSDSCVDMSTLAAPSNVEEIQIESQNPNDSIRAMVDDVARLGIQGNGSADKALVSSYSSGEFSFSSNGARIPQFSLKGARVSQFSAKGSRIPLPWELVQPVLRILGHCLLGPMNPPEVVDAASVATRVLFARVSHEVVPEAILASRSLIRLDIAARLSNEIAISAANGVVNSSTPTKSKKPEVLLVSK